MRNPILKYDWKIVYAKANKPGRKYTKKTETSIPDEKYNYLLNHMNSKFDDVFKRLETALTRVGREEDTQVRDNQELLQSGIPLRPNHDFRTMTQPLERKPTKNSEKKGRRDRRKSGSQSEMQKNSGVPTDQLVENYGLNIEASQETDQISRQR